MFKKVKAKYHNYVIKENSIFEQLHFIRHLDQPMHMYKPMYYMHR